ncbi:TetR/AcrR family transcriptional regulator [Microbacterium sp. NPDC077663]|uniref:TetR/AcrR family transcriptional regulator n=1 Tax=Microbacterium sp. NPDC077663 TaxID=3364189 RepID=UPI0037C7B03E
MPRTYHSPLRAAEAASTRTRIITAAASLFVRDGYGATSFRAIAAHAGVSVPTVQLQGPKHALLIAAFEVSFAGDEGTHPLTERPHVAQIMAEPDTDTALDRYVEFLVDANARTAALTRVMMAAADSDPAARTAYEDLEQRRHRDMRLAAGWFASRDRISPDEIDVAADLLGHVTGADSYLHFTGACGWSPARYGAWLTGELHHLGHACAVALTGDDRLDRLTPP